MLHRISAVSEETKTGVCSVCGPVQIRRKGQNGYWRCMTKVREQKRRDRERNPWSGYKPEHGLTHAEAQDYIASRGSACEICGDPGGQTTGTRLVIDHDHRTGVIRGALCRRCNVALGHMRDNASLLLRAATYLKRAAK